METTKRSNPLFDMEYLTIGFVSGSHGLDGTVKVISTSHFARDRYAKVKDLYLLDKDGKRISLSLLSFKIQGDLHYLKFKEITNPEDAKILKGSELQIAKTEAIVPEGYYLFADLVGCAILDEKGAELGFVAKIEEFPAQTTLRIQKKDGNFFFIPFIDEFVINVDIKEKIITVKLIPGML